MPVADIGSFFYGSDEYFFGYGAGNSTIWITDLYQKLMLRSPDSGGLNYWVSQLAGGMSRAAVSHWFYQSPEKRGLRVDSLYQHILGRSSDAGGREYWAARLYGEGDLALASFLASSPEYRSKQFVNRLQSATFTVSTTSIRPGDTVHVSGSGYRSGTQVGLEIHSDPVDLGDISIDTAGNFSGDIVIPSDIPEGSHTLFALGTSSSGSPVTNTIGVSLDRTGPTIDLVVPGSSSNVFTIGDTIDISITGADSTGIQTMGFWFADVTGGGMVQRDFCGQQLTRYSGSGAGSQTWTYSCTVPNTVIDGEYEIRAWAMDDVGNYTNMNSGGQDSTIGAFSITGGISDRTGPSIDLVEPSSLSDSFTPGDSLTLSVTGTDLSGIQTMGFSFRDITGGAAVQRDFCGQQLTRSSGSGTGTQTWTYVCTVPSTVINGDYQINAWAVDIYGNYTNMNSGSSDPTVGAFSITGGISDRTGPSIDVVTPSSVFNSYTVGDTLLVSVTGNDISGIQTMGFWFADVTGGGMVQRDFCGQQLARASGSGSGTQTWTYSCTVPDRVIVGDYEIRAWAMDIYGNYTNMNSGNTDPTVGAFSIRQ
jgi:uncharacterized protein YdeI (BOF family)